MAHKQYIKKPIAIIIKYINSFAIPTFVSFFKLKPEIINHIIITNNDAYDIAMGDLKIKYAITLVIKPKTKEIKLSLKNFKFLFITFAIVNITIIITAVNKNEDITTEI